jgi:hypothetical protein
VDLFAFDRVTEGPHDGLLAHDISEAAGPVAAVKGSLLLVWLLLCGHRWLSLSGPRGQLDQPPSG